ncbi:MAG TPA: helix-turn-helix domain-containing protein [Gemmataceae bacterium]|nr:helix-turn-helix domain-containing protein [Gemmataceae bacterium]
MTDAAFYSPAEVSQALGVSTSTIKRWVDDGVLPAHKTAGGHRKLLRADVLRLVRERNFPQLDLTRLDLPAMREDADTAMLSRRLLEGLHEGDMAVTRAVIHGAFAAGIPLETLADDVIAPAMHRLGDDWAAGRIDVMHEHRGTLTCVAALHELKPALEASAHESRPMAIGGNPEGDHSLLASLLIQMVLFDAGWDAVNLGPNTPLASFRMALGELKPRLVWLSASHLPDAQCFLDEYREFYQEAEGAGVLVAIGGLAFQNSLRAMMPYTFYGDSLAHLAAFARTLHPRPRLPKRGRPARQMP